MIKPKITLQETVDLIEEMHDAYCNRIIFAQQQITFYQEQLTNRSDLNRKRHMMNQLNIWNDDEKQLQRNRIDLYHLITTKIGTFTPNYHDCKYCELLTIGSDEDVLCNDCQQIFGHEKFSQL